MGERRSRFNKPAVRAALSGGLHDIFADHPIAQLVDDEFVVQIVELTPGILVGCSRRTKRRGADKHCMLEGADSGLFLRVDAMPHWPALHEDDRMMTVFPGYGG